MTTEQEQAAKWKILEDRKQASERVTVLKSKARQISESLSEVAKILATTPQLLNVSQEVPEHALGTLIDVNFDDLDPAKIRTIVRELCVALERFDRINDEYKHLNIG